MYFLAHSKMTTGVPNDENPWAGHWWGMVVAISPTLLLPLTIIIMLVAEREHMHHVIDTC